MAASSDLFELIKSLSKSEKRYFRMSASLNTRDGDTKYLRLFDLIDAQSRHDDAAIRDAFAVMYPVRHFSEAKYYLYKAILRSLHAYAAERSVDVQITMLLHQASILFDRKLFRQSEKLLARAREQAVRHERWHLAAEARRQEYRLVTRKGGGPEQVEELLAGLAAYGDRWRRKHDYWGMYARVLARIRAEGMPRNSAQLAAFVELLNGETRLDHHPADAPSDIVYHGYSIAICQEAAGDYRAAIRTYRELLPYAERATAWGETPQQSVTPILCNLCLNAIGGADVESFNRYYPMLLELAESSPASVHFEARLLALTFLVGLRINMGEYRLALEAAAPLEEAIANARASGHVDVVRASNPAMLLIAAHFGLGQYDRAIDYVNAVLEMVPHGLPAFHYGLTRIYQLMVHFERGDYDLLEHLLRAAHRHFIANRAGYRAEEAMISFIKRALRSRDRAELNGLFAWLLEEITPLVDDPFENIFLHWIDLVPWLESKVHGRPYAELVREAFLRKGREGVG